MKLVLPLNEDKIKNHVGQKVCAVLYDGTCFYGTLSSVREGELIFKNYFPGQAKMEIQQKNAQPEKFLFMNKGVGDFASVPITVVSTVFTSL